MKLINGECIEEMEKIKDGSIDLILCDLPYGTTNCKWDSVIPFEKLWRQYNRIIKDNGAIVLFGCEPFTSLLVTSNLKMFKYNWIWDKGRGSDFLNAKIKPLASYETISVFYKKKPTYNPQFWYSTPYKATNNLKKMECYGGANTHTTISNGKRYPLNIIKIKQQSNKAKQHPTQKPVELLEYLIKTYTNENELVLDNTMGSGSCGVAAVNTNRKFIGIELDPNYFDIAQKRIMEAMKNAN